MKAVRFQTAAFDAKCNQQECFVASARYSFGHTILGTLQGTLAVFFRFMSQKTALKRGKAAVF
jgi:hypothetical protein